MTDHPTAQLAIHLALEKHWKKALSINLALIEQNPRDIDSYKRAAYAYLQLGDLKKAKAYYKKVLTIDNANPLALKALRKLEHTGASESEHESAPSPHVFLEEPGRTKIVSLVNLAPSKVLYTISAGQKVVLNSKKYSIEVRDTHKTYLGALPDDLAHRLLPFIASGNQYDAFVHHVDAKELSLFIREIKRSKKFSKTPSFNINNNSTYTPFVREDLIAHETLEIEGGDEHEE